MTKDYVLSLQFFNLYLFLILRQFSVAQLLCRFQPTTAFIFWILVFIFDILILIVHL